MVGVIGDPVSHSRSPAMHNAAFEALEMDWVYVPFHVRASDLRSAVAGFQALGIRGVNATIPHKTALLSLVTELSPEAEFIGAVNTLVFESAGKIYGDNTDARGFVAAMDEAGIERPCEQKVVVLGAGGAARAIVAALVNVGVREIVIVNRTASKAESFAEEIAVRTTVKAIGIPLVEEALRIACRDAALLVNATAGGMDGVDPLLFCADGMLPPMVVYDIVYTPPETPLLKVAAANGCRTLNGLGMLVHQGALAFEQWTGIRPPVNVMTDALVASL